MHVQEAKFQHYEEIVTTGCEGGDPNNTPYENDAHGFCYSLMKLWLIEMSTYVP